MALDDTLLHHYDTFDSPCGPMLLVASDAGLAGVYFDRQKYLPRLGAAWRHAPAHALLQKTKKQLREYFAGDRREFDLPLDPAGTPFQRAVWKAIGRVPYGHTITYAELAKRAGHPEGPRAAGAATGRNPISVIVPCHRIVGTDGSLTGYAGGIPRKRALLKLESGTRDLLLAAEAA
jgi:methylated-DNA-[protein]-cysteine S-methyltransferase